MALGQDVVIYSEGGTPVEVTADYRLKVDTLLSADTTLPPTPTTLGYFVINNKVWSSAEQINMTASDTDNPVFLLKNPAGSGKKIYLYKISAGVNVTNVRADFRVYVSPTITANGTALTITNNYVGGSGSSSMEAYKLPTVSSLGTLMRDLINGQNNNSVILGEDFSIVINEGYSMLITGNPASNNRAANLSVVWVEV